MAVEDGLLFKEDYVNIYVSQREQPTILHSLFALSHHIALSGSFICQDI